MGRSGWLVIVSKDEGEEKTKEEGGREGRRRKREEKYYKVIVWCALELRCKEKASIFSNLEA